MGCQWFYLTDEINGWMFLVGMIMVVNEMLVHIPQPQIQTRGRGAITSIIEQIEAVAMMGCCLVVMITLEDIGN